MTIINFVSQFFPIDPMTQFARIITGFVRKQIKQKNQVEIIKEHIKELIHDSRSI